MAEDEFAVIARHFAPLAADPAARGLLDDVAVWTPPPGPLVVTADAIVEGVHFLPDDPIDTVGQKALRVNLSDLAAKAAEPLGYLLTLAWPRDRPAAQIQDLAAGLAADQALFGVKLFGGDTTATPGPLSISVTMFGRPRASAPPARSGAEAGDDLWVTGAIGDGRLGLLAAQGELTEIGETHRAALVEHYRRPRPRLDCAALIAAHATASMDVSDGLLADAAKMAEASRVAISILLEAIPVSSAGAEWLARQADAQAGRLALATGGDDYQVLFAARASSRAAVAACGLAIRIGAAVEGAGLTLVGARGPVAVPAGGYAHRLGR